MGTQNDNMAAKREQNKYWYSSKVITWWHAEYFWRKLEKYGRGLRSEGGWEDVAIYHVFNFSLMIKLWYVLLYYWSIAPKSFLILSNFCFGVLLQFFYQKFIYCIQKHDFPVVCIYILLRSAFIKIGRTLRVLMAISLLCKSNGKLFVVVNPAISY